MKEFFEILIPTYFVSPFLGVLLFIVGLLVQ